MDKDKQEKYLLLGKECDRGQRRPSLGTNQAKCLSEEQVNEMLIKSLPENKIHEFTQYL